MFGHFRGNLTEANNSSFCMSSVSAGARLELDRFTRNRRKSHLIPTWQIFFEHLRQPWNGSSVGLCSLRTPQESRHALPESAGWAVLCSAEACPLSSHRARGTDGHRSFKNCPCSRYEFFCVVTFSQPVPALRRKSFSRSRRMLGCPPAPPQRSSVPFVSLSLGLIGTFLGTAGDCRAGGLLSGAREPRPCSDPRPRPRKPVRRLQGGRGWDCVAGAGWGRGSLTPSVGLLELSSSAVPFFQSTFSLGRCSRGEKRQGARISVTRRCQP